MPVGESQQSLPPPPPKDSWSRIHGGFPADLTEWQFLWNVLRRHGFLKEWVRWIKLCVITASFSVLVNGRPHGGGSSRKGASIRFVCLYRCFSFYLLTPWLIARRDCARGVISQDFRWRGPRRGETASPICGRHYFFSVQGFEAAARTLSSMDIFLDFSRLQ